MRLIGVAERALESMCRRVRSRVAFGKTLAEQGAIRADIANSRIEIEQARPLVLKAAYIMDTVGNKAARSEIAMIKVLGAEHGAARARPAIQAHGGGISRGLSNWRLRGPTPARCGSRMVRTKFTGKRSRLELKKYEPAGAATS